MIKNIIFDAGDVLRTINNAPVNDVLGEKLLKKYGDKYQDLNVQDIYRKCIKGSSAYLEYDKGLLEEEKMIEIVSKELGEPKDVLDKVFGYRHVPQASVFFEPTFKLIRKLKTQGCHIYILSNMSKQLSMELKAGMDMTLFDDTIFSCDTGLTKPSKEMFEFALKKWNLKAKESIFIDDSAKNLPPFEELGGHTFLFNPKDTEKSANEIELYINKENKKN